MNKFKLNIVYYITNFLNSIYFLEARTHGVGYFNFSQDENERKQQQEALKILREETEKSQMFTINLKEKRKQQMKQRIAAAKKRKCQRMGLVLEEEIDETCAEGANSFVNQIFYLEQIYFKILYFL